MTTATVSYPLAHIAYHSCELFTDFLNALEQTEARVMRGKTRAETLRKRLMEQVEYTKTILARAEKAEANVARMRARLEPQERLHSVMKEARNQMNIARRAVADADSEVNNDRD